MKRYSTTQKVKRQVSYSSSKPKSWWTDIKIHKSEKNKKDWKLIFGTHTHHHQTIIAANKCIWNFWFEFIFLNRLKVLLGAQKKSITIAVNQRMSVRTRKSSAEYMRTAWIKTQIVNKGIKFPDPWCLMHQRGLGIGDKIKNGWVHDTLIIRYL